MKGLVISLAAFVVYVIFTMLVSHFAGVRRYGRLFFPAVLACTPSYFLLYAATPPDCWIIPESWLGQPWWLDLAYGYVVYLLNCHSYIDVFFGVIGGFSTSLLHALLKAGHSGSTTRELTAGFHADDEGDKIYRRRIPHLTAAGMITVDGPLKLCRATPKGRRWASVLFAAKRLLCLEKGG